MNHLTDLELFYIWWYIPSDITPETLTLYLNKKCREKVLSPPNEKNYYNIVKFLKFFQGNVERFERDLKNGEFRATIWRI